MRKSTEETLHLQQLQQCSGHMKYHISHSWRKLNSNRNSERILIDIMHIPDVIIVSKLGGVTSIYTNLFTYYIESNKRKNKIIQL